MLAHFLRSSAEAATHLHAAEILRAASIEIAPHADRFARAAHHYGVEGSRAVLDAGAGLPRALRSFLLAQLGAAALYFEGPVKTPPRRRGGSALSSGAGAGSAADAEGTRQPSTRAKILIDLSDVVFDAIWHEVCTGIPRVQLEIVTHLFRADRSVTAIAVHHGKWRDLGPLIAAADGDVDAAFALVKETFLDFKFTAAGFERFMRKRRRKLNLPIFEGTPEIGPQDTLYVGGAFWVDRGAIELCRSAVAKGAQLVVMFHDLIPLSTPAFTGHDFAQDYVELLRLPAHFIVTSEYNRRELKRSRASFNDVGARTCSSVVNLADEFPGSRRNEPARAGSKRLDGLKGRAFALCVGTIEIRKNHHALIEAWNELAAEEEDLPILVVAGRRGWKAHATLMRLDALDEGGPVMFIETPNEDELRWLYASCLFTVFPSFFEGWGLPVGESFWFGKPCAASNAPSIAPVARGLCAFFSPYHADEMKGAIRRLLDPRVRQSFRSKIEAEPLRDWAQVAADVATLIGERRPASEAIPTLDVARA